MISNQPLKHYPLSSPQREIWFDQMLHHSVPLYNIGGYVRIEGPIDPAIFENAFNHVIAENDALRIILHEGESLPTQTFAENVSIKLDFHDFSKMENAHELALNWIRCEFVKPFQLYDGLLFQFALCKASDNCYYWLKKYHHLIMDGWAISLIVQRVAAAYNALVIGETSEQTNYAYPDFIQNDQAYFDSEKFVKAKHYWQEKYREVPEPLLVHHHGAHTMKSQRSTLYLKRPFFQKLIDFAKENNSSTFHLILGALYCYFVRTCDREDLVIGLPILNRSTVSFKQTVGLFTSVIPAWFRFGTDLSFLELMRSIGLESRLGLKHRRFPLGEINRQLGLARKNRQPLFDLTLSYMDHNYDTNFAGNTLEFIFLPHGFEQTALAIFVDLFHEQRDIRVNFDYNLGAFDEDEIERLKARFEFILGEILRQPLVPIRELQIMPDVELKKILVDWNNTETYYPRDKTIVDLFEEQVDKTPEAIAVVFENQQLTYRRLNRKANQLAHYLQTLGVKPEVLVGICVERSCEMVIGLLGILKAGGAYVPLDPAYPNARLAFMLEDAQVPVLLTQSSLKEKLPETKAQVVCLDVEAETLSPFRSENLISGVTPLNLAYVIYTSGSTGKPKGTLIIHQGLVNYLSWSIEHYQVASGSGAPVHSPLGFDATITSLFLPLLVGQRILLLPASPEAILTAIQSFQKWSLIKLTPAHLEILNTLLLSEELLGKTRFLILGGDALFGSSLSLWRIGAPETRIINEYGPTETVVGCCVYEVDANTPREGVVPIGRPIANTQLYILDNFLQPLPIGVPGELHIGGAGLARGYLNRPELTAEKFITNPFSSEPNSRLYKTGDLARYLADGNIEYLGRIDNQVSIRGFRIELSEIEAVLAQHPSVQQNAVIVHEASKTDKRLVAYFVPHKGQFIENTALRSFLTSLLPDYMIPLAFVTIDTLPLTPNGKIDRRALSQLSVSHSQLSEKTFVAPRTPDEELLADIWASVLGIERVGVHDNFFELGGHSLLAVSLLAQIEQQFGKQLPLSALFQGATIAELAKLIKPSTNTTDSWAPLVAIQANGAKRPFFCLPGAGGNVLYYHQLAHHLGIDQPFYALQAVGLDGETAPDTRVEDMAARYIKEIQTVQPQGPYLLIRWSFFWCFSRV